MTVLFISDLHLSAETPALTTCFLDFLTREASQAQRLYILGDFFEMWIGDDSGGPLASMISRALKQLSLTTAIYIMRGNRDFLLGKGFMEACGASLLDDPTVIDLYGIPTLLTHGDLLCSSDKLYQYWRKVASCRPVQALFLALPLRWRNAIAGRLRKQSQRHVDTLAPAIMDVTSQSIRAMLDRYPVKQIIHGHTHRPTIEYFYHRGQPYWRFVLSDWHQVGNALIVNAESVPRLITLN